MGLPRAAPYPLCDSLLNGGLTQCCEPGKHSFLGSFPKGSTPRSQGLLRSFGGLSQNTHKVLSGEVGSLANSTAPPEQLH